MLQSDKSKRLLAKLESVMNKKNDSNLKKMTLLVKGFLL